MSGNTPVWYALQVFHHKGDTLLLHLERNWVKCFFPICHAEHAGTSGKSRRSLLPATHDQLFVQYGQGKGPILAETLQASPYTSRVYTKTVKGWCGIRRAEMAEPHAASIRNLRGTVRRGRISGRTRRNAHLRRPQPAQRYQWKVGKTQAGSYVVLIAVSIGVMVQVSKWRCHPSKTGTCIPHQQEKKTGDFSCREKHPRTQPDASR